jgi:hypothetical protein
MYLAGVLWIIVIMIITIILSRFDRVRVSDRFELGSALSCKGDVSFSILTKIAVSFLATIPLFAMLFAKPGLLSRLKSGGSGI